MTRADPLLYEDRSGRRPPVRAESDLAKKPYIPRWQGRPVPGSPLFTKIDGCCIADEWKPHVWEALTVLLQVDSWVGTDDEQAAAKQDVEELVHRLLTDKCCPQDRPPRRALPAGITWDGQNLHICMEELDMPGDIYIYQGCCPDGTGGMLVGGDNTGADQGGGDVPLGSQATKCDIATYLIPYINSQALEWLQAVDTAITNGATAVDAILGQTVSIFDPTEIGTTFIDNLAEVIAIGLDGLIVAFNDVDMLLRVQENWWGKTTATHYDTFTRSDLRLVGSSYPLAWGSVNFTTPRLFMEVFTRFADVQRVATRVLLARGEANQALCEYLANSNGEEYTPPPTTTLDDVSFASGGTDFIIHKRGPLTLLDTAQIDVGFTVETGRMIVGVCYEFPDGEPQREGVNEDTTLYNAGGVGVLGLTDVSENLTGGFTLFLGNSLYLSQAQADALAAEIGATSAFIGDAGAAGTVLGPVTVRHRTGSPFPPGAASTCTAVYIVTMDAPTGGGG